jgi:hypothetical protein
VFPGRYLNAPAGFYSALIWQRKPAGFRLSGSRYINSAWNSTGWSNKSSRIFDPDSEDDAKQLRHSAKSIIRNICEGAGEFRRAENNRFYRMALRSAEESGGTIKILIEDMARGQFTQKR